MTKRGRESKIPNRVTRFGSQGWERKEGGEERRRQSADYDGQAVSHVGGPRVPYRDRASHGGTSSVAAEWRMPEVSPSSGGRCRAFQLGICLIVYSELHSDWRNQLTPTGAPHDNLRLHPLRGKRQLNCESGVWTGVY